MKGCSWLLIMVIILFSGCAAHGGQSERALLRPMDGGTGAAVNQITLATLPAPEDDTLPQFAAVQLQQEQRQWTAVDGTIAFTHQTDNAVVSIPENAGAEEAINAQWTINRDEMAEQAEAMAAQALAEYQAREELGLWDFYGYSNYATADIARLDGAVLSLVTYHSTYTGGAHPNNWQSAWNFDVLTGAQLCLADVLTEQGADRLRADMLAWLNQRAQEFGFLTDYQEVAQARLAENLEGIQNNFWYFSEDGLVLFFSPYDISPYAAGVIKAELPYTQLEGIVRPVYLPRALPESDGTAEVFLVNPEAVRVQEDGMELEILVHGMIQNVSIAPIQAAGLHVLEGNTQYAANYLYNGCMLQIACRLSDDAGIRLAYEANGEQCHVDVFYDQAELILQGGNEL